MKPMVKQFSRDQPCTKLEIWNCFKGRRGWRRVQVDIAHSKVGINAPRYMLKQGYLTVGENRQVEYYSVTRKGQDWLWTKFRSYLINHPEDRSRAINADDVLDSL